MTHLKRWLALAMLLTLSACAKLATPLSDQDLKHWTRAYANIAAASSELNEEMQAAGTTDVLTCPACLITMSDAATRAGFEDLPSFVLIDTRIRIAQYHIVHKQMTALLGKMSSGLINTDGCALSETVKGDQGLTLLCVVLAKKMSSMESASKKSDVITGALTGDEDIAFVTKHYAHIDRASSDPRLIDGYRSVWPEEVMRAASPAKMQACQRIELGVGDAADRRACPSAQPPRRTPA